MFYTKAFFRRCGEKGGKIGGAQRAKKLSAARRTEIAKMGGAARAAQRKKNGGGE